MIRVWVKVSVFKRFTGMCQ